jgi:hypothetical protein
MKLVRNTTEDGTCKYAIVRMDKVRQLHPEQRSAVMGMLETLQGIGVLELAGKNDPEEAFTIKLKDIHAAGALFAYARSCDQYDPELARDVFELASRSAHRKDARHPTV